MTINDGGPAFPVECSYNGEGKIVGSQTGVASGWEIGMTLRDYFAAQALNGALARTTLPEYELAALFGRNRTGIRREEIIAADAYRIADAMLARRDFPQESTDAKA